MSVKQIITCGYCHRPYQMPRSRPDARKFCSQSCYFAYKRSTAFRPCRRCGKPVEKKTNLTYCSNQCYGKAQRKPRQTFTCATCGKPYQRHGFQQKSQWCSRACKHTFIERHCLVCGVVFRVQQYRKNISRFCSQDCAFRYRGETSLEKIVRESLEQVGLLYLAQFRVGRYFIDFFLPLLNVAIEADGNHWHRSKERQERDARRDAFLLSRGIHTIRLPESEIQSCCDLPKLITSKLHKKTRC